MGPGAWRPVTGTRVLRRSAGVWRNNYAASRGLHTVGRNSSPRGCYIFQISRGARGEETSNEYHQHRVCAAVRVENQTEPFVEALPLSLALVMSTLDKHMLKELLLVCSALGSVETSEHGEDDGEKMAGRQQRFVRGENCLEWLQDLQRLVL